MAWLAMQVGGLHRPLDPQSEQGCSEHGQRGSCFDKDSISETNNDLEGKGPLTIHVRGTL